MPNWCSNKIIITGDNSKINEILAKIGTIPVDSKPVLFKTLIGGAFDDPETRESNLKNYGTKWDVCTGDSNIEFSDDTITMTPATAWSPPVPFCLTLAKEYGVNVKILYFEPGCDFAGTCDIDVQGEITNEEDYDYNEGTYILDKDEFWNDRTMDYLDEEELDGRDLKTYISQTFSYLNEEDSTKLLGIYENLIKEQDEEDSGE